MLGSRLAAATLILLVGCGGEAEIKPRSSATRTAVPEPSETTLVAQRDWLPATVKIAQPDALAALDGSVYVRSNEGEVWVSANAIFRVNPKP